MADVDALASDNAMIRSVRPVVVGLTLIGAAAMAASCTPFAIPTATFHDGTEALPGPGYFHVVGDPEIAVSTVIVRSFGSDGVDSQVSDSFEAGQVIVVDGTAFSGPRGLSVDGVRCDGRFPIVQDKVTGVILHLDEGGCEVTVAGIKEVEPP